MDLNFAVHLPVIDRLFGTSYLPDGRWPDAYGLAGPPVPDGWVRQLLWPLARRAEHRRRRTLSVAGGTRMAELNPFI